MIGRSQLKKKWQGTLFFMDHELDAWQGSEKNRFVKKEENAYCKSLFFPSNAVVW